MDILEYLFRNKITKTAFAQQLGYSRTHLHTQLFGTRPITPETAKKIEDITGGQVTRLELRPDIFG